MHYVCFVIDKITIRKVKYRGILWEILEETDSDYLLLYGDCQIWLDKAFVSGDIIYKEIEVIL